MALIKKYRIDYSFDQGIRIQVEPRKMEQYILPGLAALLEKICEDGGEVHAKVGTDSNNK